MSRPAPIAAALAAACIAAALAAARADAYGPPEPQPLVAHQRATIYGATEDVLNKPLCRTGHKWATLRCRDPRHYVVSNEFDHDLFYPYIAGLGGAYAGVGADQSFTFIAWARSELAFLFDYDPDVVAVNRVHRAMLRRSADLRSFVARYGDQGQAEATAILRQEYAGSAELGKTLGAFAAHRRQLAAHFDRVLRTRYLQSHWLHAPADYAYVRKLALVDRIRVMHGDLLKGQAMRGIAAVTQRLGLPLRVLYLSNCEDFWPYPQAFRQSIAALRTDERSVVLRVWEDRSGCATQSAPFVYAVHDAQDFQRKLGDRRVRGVRAFAGEARPGGDRATTLGAVTIGAVEQLAPPKVPLLPVPRAPRNAKCPAQR